MQIIVFSIKEVRNFEKVLSDEGRQLIYYILKGDENMLLEDLRKKMFVNFNSLLEEFRTAFNDYIG